MRARATLPAIALACAVAAALAYRPVFGLGLLGWDTYPMILTARVTSFGDLLASFTQELMHGRYTDGHFLPPAREPELRRRPRALGAEPLRLPPDRSRAPGRECRAPVRGDAPAARAARHAGRRHRRARVPAAPRPARAPAGIGQARRHDVPRVHAGDAAGAAPRVGRPVRTGGDGIEGDGDRGRTARPGAALPRSRGRSRAPARPLGARDGGTRSDRVRALLRRAHRGARRTRRTRRVVARGYRERARAHRAVPGPRPLPPAVRGRRRPGHDSRRRCRARARRPAGRRRASPGRGRRGAQPGHCSSWAGGWR